MSFDLADLIVGDEVEDSPSVLSQIISDILAVGGSFSYEGSSLIIKSLPHRVLVSESVELIKEELVPPEWIKEEPIKPKTPGRPRKVAPNLL